MPVAQFGFSHILYQCVNFDTMRIVVFRDRIRDTSECIVWFRFHHHHTHTYVLCRVGHQIAATSEYHDRCLMETYLGRYLSNY